MRHPVIRMIHDYWRSLAAGRIAPNRTEIDPRSLGGGLAHLFLLDDAQEAHAFRLAGSRMAEAIGQELTGKPFLDAFLPSSRDTARAALVVAAEDGEPILAGIRLRLAGDVVQEKTQGTARASALPVAIQPYRLAERRVAQGLSGEIVLLPLFHEGKVGSRVLGAFAVHQPFARRPEAPLQLDVTGTRVLSATLRPATPLGLMPAAQADSVILRRGHLALIRGDAQNARN